MLTSTLDQINNVLKKMKLTRVLHTFYCIVCCFIDCFAVILLHARFLLQIITSCHNFMLNCQTDKYMLIKMAQNEILSQMEFFVAHKY